MQQFRNYSSEELRTIPGRSYQIEESRFSQEFQYAGLGDCLADFPATMHTPKAYGKRSASGHKGDCPWGQDSHTS